MKIDGFEFREKNAEALMRMTEFQRLEMIIHLLRIVEEQDHVLMMEMHEQERTDEPSRIYNFYSQVNTLKLIQACARDWAEVEPELRKAKTMLEETQKAQGSRQ